MIQMNRPAPHRFSHALAVPLLVGGVFIGGAFQLSSAVRNNGADVCATALPGSGNSADLEMLAMRVNPIEPARSMPATSAPIATYLTGA